MKKQSKHVPFAHDLPESVIKSLSIQVKEKKAVNLGQGIPSFPTAKHIRAAASRALDEKDIGVYPNFLGNIKFRRAIAEKLDRDHDLAIAAEREILVTVGAMEATASAILSLVNNGDRVGVVTPDYCNHFPQIQLARGQVVEIPLIEDEGWRLDMGRIEKAAKKGLTLLIITNPSNPTGAVFDSNHIGELVRLSEKYGFWVLSDETYGFLSYEERAPSLLDFWDEGTRLLTVRSFSKEYAMTGWRVGYLVSHADTRDLIAKTHDALVGTAAKISQRAAHAAITGSQSIVRSYVKKLAARRSKVCTALDGLEEYLDYQTPRGSYYIFPRYKMLKPSHELSRLILDEAGVGVIPGAIFGKGGESHIRISYAVDEETLSRGMKRLTAFFTGS